MSKREVVDKQCPRNGTLREIEGSLTSLMQICCDRHARLFEQQGYKVRLVRDGELKFTSADKLSGRCAAGGKFKRKPPAEATKIPTAATEQEKQ